MTEDIKVILPHVPVKPVMESKSLKRESLMFCVGVFLSFIILITIVTFLPLTLLLKFVVLLGGFFILEDILHYLKKVYLQ